MKLISQLFPTFLRILTIALIMMGGASSQAQAAPLCDTKIIKLTIGDYQEFQKETAPDQDEDDSTLDLTAIKMDWTSQ